MAAAPSRRALANGALLVCAALWGFGFVAQAFGAQHMGAFSFNAARFAVGALSLLPLIAVLDARGKRPAQERRRRWRATVVPGLVCGAALFAGSTLQQFAMETTTAGNAAFVTGLYMVLVPLIGLFLGHRTGWATWVGIALAVTGLYLLTIEPSGFTMVTGDLLCLIGSGFWAVHILTIGHFSRRVDPLRLSVAQFVASMLYSLVCALVGEPRPFAGLSGGLGAVAYAGLVAVGIAYTLQVLGQRDAKESHAAMIMSLESVFGVLGGALFLGERLTLRGLAGAALMLAGILLAQRPPRGTREDDGIVPVPEPPSVALEAPEARPGGRER
ncbi:DMT family transporter [Nigerium massiliense]|uniref:DMT family transporter n=1 Tax=Nigerium massiliense TaxID=1522317 RepID=UPI0009077820|nr:DMT family transporter [Nigerium massiliense]